MVFPPECCRSVISSRSLSQITTANRKPLSRSYFCRTRASCNQNRTLCHANADCVFNNRLREYECVCSYSYFGDGFDCRPLEKHGEEHIIVAQGMSLLNLSVETGKKSGKLLLTKELQTPVGLDVDCLEGQRTFRFLSIQILLTKKAFSFFQASFIGPI